MHAQTRSIVNLQYEKPLLDYLVKSLPKFEKHAVKNPASRLADLSIIHLRGPKKKEAPTGYIYGLEYTECEDRELMSEFPEVQAMVSFLRGELMLKNIGNIMMSVMGPGSFIEPHQDPGTYFEHYRRIHIPILTDPACLCYSMEHPIQPRKQLVSQNMTVGHAWELNNCDLHWFDHRGNSLRYHIVFDAC